MGLVAGVAAAPVHADPEVADPTAEELERLFPGRPRADRAPVVLVIDGAELASDGPVILELAHGSPVAPSAPIVAALEAKLGAETLARLLAVIRDDRVSVAALRTIGLNARYDARRLELQIDVPPGLTASISHDLGADAPPEAARALAPSDASGFVNLRAGGGGTRSTDEAATTALPLHVNSDAAVNLRGWVLEGRGDLVARSRAAASADPQMTLHRGDVVVTRDDARRAVRYQAGDFPVSSAGLQRSYPLLGLGVGRNFALQPYRVVRPVGSFDFVLDRPSTITVMVNGSPVRTLQLAAGRHDLRDLPLGAGITDIELRIKDDAGIERTIAFSSASQSALLAPGVAQFSVSVGFPLTSDLGLRTYDYARPVLSGRYRSGVTAMLTLGGSFDGDFAHQVGGGGLAVATQLGSFSLDAAASRDGAGRGLAATARYDYTSGGSASALALIGHHYGPGFRALGPDALDTSYRSDLALSATGRPSPRMTGRLEMRYQIGRDIPDAQYLALGVARSFGALAIDASVSALRDQHTHDDVRLLIVAHWTIPKTRTSVHAASRASSATGITNEAIYSRHPGSPAGGLATSLRVVETPTEIGAGATLDYTGAHVTTSLSAVGHLGRDGTASTQAASFEVATALAFAGGQLAWSRPITGAFAIVERHRALNGVAIGVNPSLGGYAAEVGALGTAVVPSLEPYRVNRVRVDAPALPIGASLGPASYTLLPTYKSGTLLRVGEAGTVFLRGVLLHYNGESLALAVAELRSLDDRRRAPVVVMTNRAGRFSAMGVQPGRYAIRLSGDTMSSAELEIPVGTTGLYSAGIVEVR